MCSWDKPAWPWRCGTWPAGVLWRICVCHFLPCACLALGSGESLPCGTSEHGPFLVLLRSYICWVVKLCLFLPQDMDPLHPFPKEIPHNEKLLSLKYEVGPPAPCPLPRWPT